MPICCSAHLEVGGHICNPKHVVITGMFKNPEFQQHSTVDKRGRKVEKRKNQENMRKYYKLRDQVCSKSLAAKVCIVRGQFAIIASACTLLNPSASTPVAQQGLCSACRFFRWPCPQAPPSLHPP